MFVIVIFGQTSSDQNLSFIQNMLSITNEIISCPKLFIISLLLYTYMYINRSWCTKTNGFFSSHLWILENIYFLFFSFVENLHCVRDIWQKKRSNLTAWRQLSLFIICLKFGWRALNVDFISYALIRHV